MAPPIGGLLSQTIGWRYVFRLQMPLVAISLAGAVFLFPKQAFIQPKARWTALFDFDLLGLTAFMMGTILLYFAFAQGAVVSWSSYSIWTALLCALVAFVTFGVSEWKSRHSFVPSCLLKDRSLLASCLINILTFTGSNLSEIYLVSRSLSIVVHY